MKKSIFLKISLLLLLLFYPSEIAFKWVLTKNSNYPSCAELAKYKVEERYAEKFPQFSNKAVTTDRKLEAVWSASQLGFVDTLKLASKNSIAYKLKRTREYSSSGYDKSYKKSEHVDALINEIPRKYHKRIMNKNSLKDALNERNNILDDLETSRMICLQI